MNNFKKAFNIAHSEVRQLHPRLWLANLLMSALPLYVGSRLRTKLLRLAGFQLGKGTLFFGAPVLTGLGNIYENLVMGKECLVSWGCYFDLQGAIQVGDRVGISPQVTVLTSSHEVGSPYNRVGPLHALPVVIEDGVWLGARCTIMPGITIHKGAVVAAGAVVTKDVEANAVVGGVPARVLRILPGVEDERITDSIAVNENGHRKAEQLTEAEP